MYDINLTRVVFLKITLIYKYMSIGGMDTVDIKGVSLVGGVSLCYLFIFFSKDMEFESFLMLVENVSIHLMIF